MRNPAFVRPRKPESPALLTIPNRERVVSIFKDAAGPVDFIDIELERRETLTHGEVSVVTVFVRGLPWPRVEHFLPKECTPQQIEGAAEILGRTLRGAIANRR